MAVLILILLEDTLWGDLHYNYEIYNFSVLIIILLEDTLWAIRVMAFDNSIRS